MKGLEIRIDIIKIDIYCIQETHNTTDDITALVKYKVYFSKATGNIDNMNGIGGLSIMVRGI